MRIFGMGRGNHGSRNWVFYQPLRALFWPTLFPRPHRPALRPVATRSVRAMQVAPTQTSPHPVRKYKVRSPISARRFSSSIQVFKRRCCSCNPPSAPRRSGASSGIRRQKRVRRKRRRHSDGGGHRSYRCDERRRCSRRNGHDGRDGQGRQPSPSPPSCSAAASLHPAARTRLPRMRRRCKATPTASSTHCSACCSRRARTARRVQPATARRASDRPLPPRPALRPHRRLRPA